MDRIAIGAVNVLLLVLCCYLIARVVTKLGEEVLGPEIAASTDPSLAAIPERDRSWNRYEVIVSRNLFKSSSEEAAPVEVVEEVEEVDEITALPLRLIGTAFSEFQDESWAAVEDLQARNHLIVRIGDRLQDKATVHRIDRRSVVLQEGERLTKLALDAETTTAPVKTARNRRPPKRPSRNKPDDLASRIKRLGDDRFGVPREDMEETVRNPTNLINQARMLPKYENGEMIGIQLQAIKPGSFFEAVGITNGDVITELNGEPIDSPQVTANVLRELSEGEGVVTVMGPDGEERPITFEALE